MVVYLDVVIIENLIINFFLLLITMQIMSFEVKYRRVFLASMLGALYTLVLFLPQLSFLTTFIAKSIVALFMVYVVIKNSNIFNVLKGFVIFLMVSFMFCGICFMFALVQNNYDITKAFIIENYSTKYLLFGGMIIYISISRVILYIKDRMKISNLIYDLEINIDNKVKTIRAFLDTGNELIEPITALPVIIVEKSNFLDVIINEKEQFNIPYKVVNGNKGNIKGLRVKGIKIFKDDGQILNKEAIICFCDGTLSNNGDYEALLSRGII